MRDKGMQEPGAPNLRGLKALVIGLGILIVLGTALVIGVAVHRVLEPTGGPQPGAVSGPGRPRFRIDLPGGTGARIAGVAATDGLVAVWLHDDAGGRVVFIDPRTGRIVGTAAPAH